VGAGHHERERIKSKKRRLAQTREKEKEHLKKAGKLKPKSKAVKSSPTEERAGEGKPVGERKGDNSRCCQEEPKKGGAKNTKGSKPEQKVPQLGRGGGCFKTGGKGRGGNLGIQKRKQGSKEPHRISATAHPARDCKDTDEKFLVEEYERGVFWVW